MATIRATCGDCGDVELTTADVNVRVCADNDQGEYSFVCPVCQMMVAKRAEPRTIDLLLASGVALTTWTLPLEMRERPAGEPITHDDLIDFHSMLHNDEMLQRELTSILGD